MATIIPLHRGTQPTAEQLVKKPAPFQPAARTVISDPGPWLVISMPLTIVLVIAAVAWLAH